MTRRALLAMMTGAVLDPERLLWVRGAKTISIPAPVMRQVWTVYWPQTMKTTIHTFPETSNWPRVIRSWRSYTAEIDPVNRTMVVSLKEQQSRCVPW